jgi:hypothetical protein
MLRPFNEEKVKRTEEVRVQVHHDALRSTVTLAAVCFQRSQYCACLQQLPVHAVHHQYLQQSVQERAAASELRAARQRLRPQADQRGLPARHCSVFVLILHQVSPHVNAPLARVARNRGVSEDSYTQVGDHTPVPIVFAMSFSRVLGGAAHNGSDERAGGQGKDRALLSFCVIV